jgi:hypothetical protein
VGVEIDKRVLLVMKGNTTTLKNACFVDLDVAAAHVVLDLAVCGN